jgi:hypothetical protein
MICSYNDDSSDEKRSRWVSSGGIVGHETLINLFEQLWIEQTKLLKEPFRSTECECQHGQFARWKKSDCDALMARLVNILCERRGMQRPLVGAFASVVPVPLYRQFFPECREDAPYRLAIAHSIVQMARLAKNDGRRVKMWFEDSAKHHTLIFGTFKELISLEAWSADERERLVGISFGTKALVPLQAADLIAREGFKAADNQGKRPIRKPLYRIWDQCGILQWTETSLSHLKERNWPGNLRAIASLPDDCYVRVVEPKNDGTQYLTYPKTQVAAELSRVLENLKFK